MLDKSKLFRYQILPNLYFIGISHKLTLFNLYHQMFPHAACESCGIIRVSDHHLILTFISFYFYTVVSGIVTLYFNLVPIQRFSF